MELEYLDEQCGKGGNNLFERVLLFVVQIGRDFTEEIVLLIRFR